MQINFKKFSDEKYEFIGTIKVKYASYMRLYALTCRKCNFIYYYERCTSIERFICDFFFELYLTIEKVWNNEIGYKEKECEHKRAASADEKRMR